MATYVAFLRAINLGEHRRVPMPALQQCLGDAGFSEVQTYLATGNVLLRTQRRTRGAVEREVERALVATFGFEVPVVALLPEELVAVYAGALDLGVAAQRRYVTFLKETPPASVAAELDGWSSEGEGARVLGRAVFWWIDHPNSAAKLSNAQVEKRLGIATTRDLKVVATLVDRWCS